MKKRCLIAGVLVSGLVALSGQSATIGYILLENMQEGFSGVDLNLQEDPEFEREIAKEILMEIDNSVGLVEHINYLEEQGHVVHMYGSQTDDQLGVDHMVENNDLIFISEPPGSGDTGSFYKGAEIPVLITESFILDDYGVVPSDQSSLFDEDINARYLRKVKDHPITNGLPEEFAPLIDDSEGSGLPFIGNYTTMGDESFNLHPDNVLLELVDPVFPDPTTASSITSTGQLPALMAFDVGELGNNPARIVFLAYGSENVTGVGLQDHELFADGSTSGIFMFEVLGELGLQVVDQAIDWLLADPDTDVEQWAIY